MQIKKKIYFIRGTAAKFYYSSLKKATKFIVDRFMKILTSHNYPNYFISQWPNPQAWVDAGMYKIFEIALNVEDEAHEVEKEKVTEMLKECIKEI